MKHEASVEEKKHALRLSKQVAGIVQFSCNFYNLNEYEAIVKFYDSETYKLLADYDTRLWWYSVYALFEIYKTELETGSAFNSCYVLEKIA
jgi:hypothetical protein